MPGPRDGRRYEHVDLPLLSIFPHELFRLDLNKPGAFAAGLVSD